MKKLSKLKLMSGNAVTMDESEMKSIVGGGYGDEEYCREMQRMANWAAHYGSWSSDTWDSWGNSYINNCMS